MSEQILQSYPVLSGSGIMSQSILDVFVLQDILDFEDAEKLKSHFRTNREIEDFLVKNRLVTKDTINKAYSILLKIPYIGLSSIEIPADAKKIITKQIAQKYGIIPFDINKGLIKIAISKPADLLMGFMKGLIKLFEDKNLALELFITGDSDFRESVTQYDKSKNNKVLIKKGSLPVIYIRNLKIPTSLLTKIPKEFIERYRVMIFGESVYGGYMVACQEPDSFVTKKVLDYIEKENNVKLEVFAASKDDFDHILSNYEEYLKGTNVEPKIKEKLHSDKKQINQGNNSEEKKSSSFSLESLFGSGAKNEPSEIIIDSVTTPQELKAEEVVKNQDRIAKEKNLNTEEKKDIVPVQPEENKENQEDGPPLKQDIKNSNQDSNKAEIEIKNERGDKEIQGKKETNLAAKPGQQEERAKSKVSFGRESLEATDLGSLLDGDVTSDAMLQSIVDEGYVPKIVAALVNYSLNQKVSDIHIEPQAKSLRIRTRIDGILTNIAKMDIALHPPIVSRIKILSKLKIDENRIPQDGKFEVSFKDRDVDVRVSAMPTVHGEKIVLRILDKSQKILSLEDLGMRGSAFDKTVASIQKPWGIVLSTGPTGSGKSTTLNAVIARLNKPAINIITLEDPVEYQTPGVNQCQIRPEIGFTFASGLRSILRQDPNIIMVGEIRDGETAGMTTQSALTGHLVLATLHTNDTAGALPRLINMGVEPFLITSSLDLVIAQRLIRLICPKCKEELKVPPTLMTEIQAELDSIPKTNKIDRDRIPHELKFYYGRGCNECKQGYKGRIGLFEVMEMSPEIENLAIARKSANDIKAQAIKEGMITMKQDGILKALEGSTTLDEVFQATSMGKDAKPEAEITEIQEVPPVSDITSNPGSESVKKNNSSGPQKEPFGDL